ncbi:MAG: FtsB family cell division protein [Actinomycetes bacterium]
MSATVGATRPVRRAPARERDATSATVATRRRRVLTGLLALGFVAFVALGPIRTWVHQRHRLAVAEQRLRMLERETAELEAKRKVLETPAEIERRAREELGMVRPGEQPYSVLPAGPSATPTP